MPVFKKVIDTDPGNYRGISLVCCFGKLFTSVINQRLLIWSSDSDIITDENTLSKVGIRGKLLTVIKSMHPNVKSCVCKDGFNSDYITNNLGLMQCEVLSPMLFSLYTNNFEMAFFKGNCTTYDCNCLSLCLLMYADDLIMLSESVEGL